MAPTKSVVDRIRRLKADTAFRREAKRLVKEEGNTLAALEMLFEGGDVTQAHVDAHKRWLDTQVEAEDLA
jgi:hypothetical protein